MLLDFPACIGDAGGGIACLRFGKDVVNGHVRDLLLDNADVFLVGNHPHIFHGTDGLEAVDGELDEGTSHAHHVDELLGIVGGGHGPEAAAYAACHYYYLYVIKVHVYTTSLQLAISVLKSLNDLTKTPSPFNSLLPNSCVLRMDSSFFFINFDNLTKAVNIPGSRNIP